LGERVRRTGTVGGLGERRSLRAPSVEAGLLSLSALETRLVAEPGPCGVIFVDLDGMKDVNDRHGHEVGDRLLRGAARRLAQVVPAGFAAPIGSDEFALLVPGLDEAVGLDWVVTRVGETLAVLGPNGFNLFKKWRNEWEGRWAAALWLVLLNGAPTGGYAVSIDPRCWMTMRELKDDAAKRTALCATWRKRFEID